MGNATAQTLALAKHSGNMTNKYTLWSGNDPTFNVNSTAAKTASLADHPSTTTYGWTLGAFPLNATGLCNVVINNFIPLMTEQNL